MVVNENIQKDLIVKNIGEDISKDKVKEKIQKKNNWGKFGIQHLQGNHKGGNC